MAGEEYGWNIQDARISILAVESSYYFLAVYYGAPSILVKFSPQGDEVQIIHDGQTRYYNCELEFEQWYPVSISIDDGFFTVSIGNIFSVTRPRAPGTLSGVRFGGQGFCEGWFDDLILIGSGASMPPQFDLIYTNPEQSSYPSDGTDIVRISTLVESSWGVGDLKLDIELDGRERTNIPLPTHEFYLDIGQSTEIVMYWQIPIWSGWNEYDIIATLKDNHGDVLDTIINYDAFVVTPLTEQQIQNLQDETSACWLGAETECQLMIQGVVPYVGSLAHGVLFVEKMCEAGELHRSGRDQEAWAAFWSGAMNFLKVGMDIYCGAGGCEGIHEQIERVKISGSAFEFASECMNNEFSEHIEYAFTRGVPEGELIDSLAVWMATGMDSSGVNLADVLMIEGEVGIRVEADSSFMEGDSTGLNLAMNINLGERGAVSQIYPGICRFDSAEDANPHSEATILLSSQANQTLHVGLLHDTQSTGRLFYRYMPFEVADSSMVRIDVADSLSTVTLAVDIDGDGTTDFNWHPDFGSDVNEPEQPLARPAIYSLSSRPNPSAGSATMSFSASRSLKDVQVVVYDVSGREVRRIALGDVGPGRKEVLLRSAGSAERLGAGVYHYRVVYAGGQSEAERAIILR
ncbi:MAG: hypothetical protein KJ970_10700 [Candidatus Eisenbacteria bacterium]|uniref:T9SS type A sorting domain-containing protein n=1 Tax=Eiseniibacteriota bacterium TaxID=2212470 RepID=A0A948RUS5_UNCEI|nr:hypothetical protein [Candidatus Eisenbacteria bacterium]